MRNNRILLLVALFLSWLSGFTQHRSPDQYDVKQYILDLEISNLHTRISGNVTMKAIVSEGSMDTAAIELIDSLSASTYMIVDSVRFNGSPAPFHHEGWMVWVPLASPIVQGQLFSLQVFYHGSGSGCSQSNSNGIFKLSYMGVSHTFNTSQPFYSKFWWPCKERMTDKADSVTFIITTDSTNKSASNGLLRSTTYPRKGKVRYCWETHYPISPYLVSFEVGPLTEYIDYIPFGQSTDSVLFYNLLVPSSPWYPMHITAIEKTKQLFQLYSQLLGEYSFSAEKYGYSIVGFPAIGMENQTMCTIGYESLDTMATRYYNSATWFMTAHELAHQWFGDAVICSDWNDAWLVDGFASYMEYVAMEHLYGRAPANDWMAEAHAEIKSQPGGSVWIPDSLVSDVRNIFDYRLIYKKGAAILHILRHEIDNDWLFFAILKQYIIDFRYGSATAADFRQIAESMTGSDLNDFFSHWYYGSGYPVFNIHWTWKDDTLVIRSEQTTSATITPVFRVHYDIRIFFSGRDTTIRLFQSGNCVENIIPISGGVDSIVFDPDRWLIQQHSVHTGIREVETGIAFRIFPNPATGKLYVDWDPSIVKTPVSVTILDISGRFLGHGRLDGTDSMMDMRDYPPGLYLIELRTMQGRSACRLVKQ